MNNLQQPPSAKTLRDIAPMGDGKPIVYICGKVTGLPYGETFAKFGARQTVLEQKGFFVINPMEIVHPEADWQNAMKICLMFLAAADFISLLHDWQDSKGATIEKELADKLGITVLPNE